MNWFGLLEGGLLVGAGVPMVWSAGKKRAEASHAVEQRLTELANGADESFFEERRALAAYPVLKTDAKYRLLGVFLTFLGLGSICIAFTGR